MSQPLLASIIISSYNYGCYLKEAIDSAMSQTYPHTEVIVVDDGSTDNSPEIIASYGDRIIPVLKENGGQASALNAGYRVSRGQVLFFLDSDDMLLPTAVQQAVKFFNDPAIVKVHWPLLVIDEYETMTGRLIPGSLLPEGDLREDIIRDGPYSYAWPDTSGNAWARRFIERIFPIPEVEFKTCPDLWLAAFAPLFGLLKGISEPQSFYRDHGNNHSGREPFDERVRVAAWREEICADALAVYCRSIGVSVDLERWKANLWYHKVRLATQEIMDLIPPGETFILVDEDQWGMDHDFAELHSVPFLEHEGRYWGPPPDGAIAILEFERLRQAGAGFIVVAWPAFWWLEYYAGLHHHLRSRFRCVLENERLVVFDLGPA